jgi:hypothetical protein
MHTDGLTERTTTAFICFTVSQNNPSIVTVKSVRTSQMCFLFVYFILRVCAPDDVTTDLLRVLLLSNRQERCWS